MANRNFDDLQVLGKGIKVLTGVFAPQGSGVPTIIEGKGFSVVRTSAGLFTITLADKWTAVRSATATIQMAALTAIWPQWGAIDVSGAKTLVLNTINASAVATDIAANAANLVHFTLVLRNSSVK